MIIEHNIQLGQYTSFKMGGYCSNFYIPETREELIELCNMIKPPRYILSGGTNIVINDHKTFENVIYLKEFDKRIERIKDGIFYVGASVRLQKLINYINNMEYGGIEYLYSVPGLVGGAVTMNAGRGRKHNNSISDYIRYVYAYRDGEVVKLDKQLCSFSHRMSCFLNSDDIVLGVEFEFENMKKEDLEKRRKERLEFCKKNQDMSYPNFGTVFCEGNMRIIRFASLLSTKKGGIQYSKKTTNWMLNKGGTFVQVEQKLKLVNSLHRLFRKNCRQEVILWR